jgi:catechol 2,3-dioxygenase-like lactoylglutathione lyase family enzyme
MAQLAAAILVVALAAAPALARPRLALSRPGAEPGQRVVVAGHGFAKRAPVRIALGARTVRRARTGRRGGFRVAFRVPDRSARLARVKGFGRGRSASRRFRIRRGSEPPTKRAGRVWWPT